VVAFAGGDVLDAAYAASLEQDPGHPPPRLDLTAGLPNESDEVLSQFLRAAVGVVAAAAMVRALRHRPVREPHPAGVVGVIDEVCADSLLDRLVRPEESLEHVSKREPLLAHERPERPGRLAKPPARVALMPDGERHGAAQPGDAVEVLADGRAAARKPRRRRLARRLEPGWHHERLPERRPPHLPKVAEVDEADSGRHFEAFQDRELGVLAVEPVELVQRGLDRQLAHLVDAGRATARPVLLEHEDAAAAARREPGGDEPAEAGADHDRVEVRAAHWSPP